MLMGQEVDDDLEALRRDALGQRPGRVAVEVVDGTQVAAGDESVPPSERGDAEVLLAARVEHLLTPERT